MTDEPKPRTNVWHNQAVSLILVVLVLGVTVLSPGVGVIPAFILALVAALVGRTVGSFREPGFRSPDSWLKLLATTLL